MHIGGSKRQKIRLHVARLIEEVYKGCSDDCTAFERYNRAATSLAILMDLLLNLHQFATLDLYVYSAARNCSSFASLSIPTPSP